MGRNTVPASVHLVRGNPSKKPLDGLVSEATAPRIPFEIPSCPAHLGVAARAEWKRITPLLVTSGLLTQLDRAVLSAYCQAWGEWALTETDLKTAQKELGSKALIDRTPSGYKQVAALAQVRNGALDRMLRFAKEFGLTPASRIQSTAGQQMALPGVPDDPMESFLSAGANLPPVH